MADQPELYRRQVLCIDSNSRENKANSTPSDYLVKFPVIKNIKMCRLISTEIPNTAYVIDSTINTIDFETVGGGPPGNAVYSCQITPGTYTATELANEINLRMNLAVGTLFGVTFTATYMTFTQKLRIDRVDGLGTFQLLWGTGVNLGSTPYLQMGFTQVDSVDDNTGLPQGTQVSSVNVVFLVGENYLYLCLKEFSDTLNSDNIQNVFAKVIMNIPPRSIAFDSFVSNEVIFQRPLDIKQLNVQWRRRTGELVGFNTIEHSFSIEFYTL